MASVPDSSPQAQRPARLLVAGFGCRRNCSVEELHRLLEDSLRERELNVGDLHALASLDGKLAEPGLAALAGQFGLPLHGLCMEQLREYEPRLSSRSEAARRATGCAGVAEASALALAEALGGASAELLIAKRRSANATFALARARQEPA
mgnify:CR=1 FL=1